MQRILCIGTVVLGLAGAAHAANPVTANGLVAIVNDEAITFRDVQQEAALAIESKIGLFAGRPAQLEKEIQKAQEEAIQILVERKLILQEFSRAGYNLPESLIEDRVRERLRERWGGDRASMTRDLKSRGLTPDRLKEQERERFIVAVMRSRYVAQEIIISPFRIEKYYVDNLEKFKVGDQIRLRTIMLNKTAGASATSGRARGEEILKLLAAGTPFAELASVYSEDTFRLQGGDRGWVELEREHYHKQLEDTIRSLKPGQRSGLIETDSAFWIVQVEESRVNFTRTLPEVRAEVEQALISEERARLEKQWIDRLKSKSFIRYF
ncbi:MAG TPA: peptidylprolyl isomerase [Verrucomicrobiota bacterium]|nr:peptidylprolyl isomerase [Verrucomicrobiota bacterium]HNU51411.1 peptidylprolyl isomerase [Verrucomicrobiota bacterium]